MRIKSSLTQLYVHCTLYNLLRNFYPSGWFNFVISVQVLVQELIQYFSQLIFCNTLYCLREFQSVLYHDDLQQKAYIRFRKQTPRCSPHLSAISVASHIRYHLNSFIRCEVNLEVELYTRNNIFHRLHRRCHRTMR